MKKALLLLVAIIATTLSAAAQYNFGSSNVTVDYTTTSSSGVNHNSTYVKGYTKANGTHVKGHFRSKPNATNHDNYSTTGNTNPYTGTTGSVAKDYSTGASNYGAGHIIYTGPKGGQYYINDKGKKVYVPKTH